MQETSPLTGGVIDWEKKAAHPNALQLLTFNTEFGEKRVLNFYFTVF